MSDDLAALQVSFAVDLSGLNSGVASAKEKIASVGSAAQDAGSQASGGFLGAIGGVVQFASNVGIAVMGLKSLGQTVIGVGQSLLAPAASAEQTGVAFDTLLHSASAAQAELAQLNQFAAKTPFQTDAINSAAEKLIAFGFSTKQVIPDITAIGDSLSALGKGTDANLQSVIDIFGKIRAQGKLSAVDMMQLSTYGIPAWNMLSQAMGKPVSVLQAMEKQGKLTADEVLPALTKGMEMTFGGGMAKQATTFNGQISTLVSNLKLGWEALLGVQGGQVVKGSLFDTVEQGLGKVGGLLSSSSLQQGLAGIGKDIASTIPQIMGLFKGIDLGGMFSGLSGAGGGIHQFFITIQKDISTINPADVASMFSDLFGVIGHGADIVGKVGGLFLNLGGSLLKDVTQSGLLKTVLSDLNSILGDVDGIVSTVVTDVSTFATGVLDAATKSGVIQDVLQAIKDILPDVDVFFNNVGSDLNQNVLPPLESLITNVGHAVGGFAQWLDKSGTATTALSTLGSIIGGVSTVAGTLVGWVADLVGWMTNGGPQTYIFAGAVGILGAAFLTLKIADTVQGFANMFVKLQEGDGIVANLASSFKDKLGKSFDDLLSNQFPNIKKNLDVLKSASEDTGQAVEDTATKVETAETEMTTGPVQLSLWDDLDTAVEGVGTTAEATATQVESIGTASAVAEGEVASSAAEMEASVGGVGTSAEASATEIEGIGAAADISKASVAAAAGSMMTSLLPVIAIMGNINQYQNNLAHPAQTASVGDNVKNGLLDSIFPAGALANVQNAWTDFTNLISAKSTDMKTNVSTNAGQMMSALTTDSDAARLAVVNKFQSMKDDSLTQMQQLSTGAKSLFDSIAGNAQVDMQNLDQYTIQYMNDAYAYVQQQQAKINDAAANAQITAGHLGSGIGKNFVDSSSFPGHASGIMNNPVGHMAVVGEQGPEIMYVPKGASIFPNDTSANMSSYPTPAMYNQLSGGGSASSQPLLVSLNIDGREFARFQAPHIVSEMRLLTSLRQ